MANLVSVFSQPRPCLRQLVRVGENREVVLLSGDVNPKTGRFERRSTQTQKRRNTRTTGAAPNRIGRFVEFGPFKHHWVSPSKVATCFEFPFVGPSREMEEPLAAIAHSKVNILGFWCAPFPSGNLARQCQQMTINIGNFSHGCGCQNQWDHFGGGAPPILVYFSWDWDVHRGYGILTHGHMIVLQHH